MKYKIRKEIVEILEIDAGDLIKWENEGEIIYAIVTRTEENKFYAISIYDNRKMLQNSVYEPHTSIFSGFFERITKILDKNDIDEKFENLKRKLFKEVD